MKKIYLAIPYTGMEENSYHQATEIMGKLLLQKNSNGEFKYNIFSPITHAHPLTKIEGVKLPGSWDYWENIDRQFIEWADEVFVIIPEEGIEKVFTSTGVKAEINIAKELGKKVSLIYETKNKLKFIKNV